MLLEDEARAGVRRGRRATERLGRAIGIALLPVRLEGHGGANARRLAIGAVLGVGTGLTASAGRRYHQEPVIGRVKGRGRTTK
jgi:hypothetical protein